MCCTRPEIEDSSEEDNSGWQGLETPSGERNSAQSAEYTKVRRGNDTPEKKR